MQVPFHRYFLSLFFLLFSTCSVIEETPIDSISVADYFQNYRDVESAVIGTYSVLTSGNSYGRLRVLLPELGANHIVHRTNLFEYSHFSDHKIVAENVLLLPIWSEAYKGIMRANNVIAAVPKLDQRNQTLSQPFLGEAYFLRALFYFDLVRMFGAIPLLTNPTNSGDLNALRVLRTDTPEVYEQISKDLLQAEKLLPEKYGATVQTRVRATKAAAKAYLAKVYLYQKNYSGCLSKINEVMANTTDYALVSFETLYSNIDHKEAIFAIFFQNEAIAAQFLPTTAPYVATGTYYVSENLRKLYDPQDKRLEYIIQSGTNWFAAKARKVRTSPADPAYCLRLAELHLLRAEVLARQANGVTEQALADLNLIRQRAGISLKKSNEFSNVESFLESVLIERRKEFAFEVGEFWFDAIRMDFAEKWLGVKDRNAYLYPIPSAELLRNPNLTQNAGY